MSISEKNKIEWEGKTVSSNLCGEFEIIEYRSTKEVVIKFIITGTTITACLGNIKTGSVKDPIFPTVYGIGYIGIGNYTTRESSSPQFSSNKRWKEMLARCYDPKNVGYTNYGAGGVTVCDEWHNYQNYAKWWDDNCHNSNYAVDKDILLKNNKEYCPKYCCFVPQEINTALTSRRHERGIYPIGVRVKSGAIIAQINKRGKKYHLGTFKTIEEAFLVYKKEKKKALKELADEYKNSISSEVYNALYEYKIEITD